MRMFFLYIFCLFTSAEIRVFLGPKTNISKKTFYESNISIFDKKSDGESGAIVLTKRLYVMQISALYGKCEFAYLWRTSGSVKIGVSLHGEYGKDDAIRNNIAAVVQDKRISLPADLRCLKNFFIAACIVICYETRFFDIIAHKMFWCAGKEHYFKSVQGSGGAPSHLSWSRDGVVSDFYGIKICFAPGEFFGLYYGVFVEWSRKQTKLNAAFDEKGNDSFCIGMHFKNINR